MRPPASRSRRLVALALDVVRGSPVTLAYLGILVGTTWVLYTSRARVARVLLDDNSTNLRHLARDPLRVLVGSAFWVSPPQSLVFWALVFAAVLAPVERRLGSRRLLGVFAAGHIGATLLTALGIWLSIEAGLAEHKLERVQDVGVSYGVLAVTAVLVLMLREPLRRPVLGALAAALVVIVSVSHEYSDFGHLLALAIGIVIGPWVLRRAQAAQAPSSGSRDGQGSAGA